MSPTKFATYLVIAVAAALAGTWVVSDNSTPAEIRSLKTGTESIPKVTLEKKSKVTNVALESESYAPLRIRLSGVVGGARGLALAVVSVNDTEDVILHVGDKLAGSSVVVAIDADSMTYRQGTREIRTFLQSVPENSQPIALRTVAPTASGSASQTPNEELAKLPGFMPSGPPLHRNDGTETPNGNAMFKQAIEAKAASMRAQP